MSVPPPGAKATIISIGRSAGQSASAAPALAAAVDSALANPEFQEKAKQQALPLAYRSGAEWQADMPKRLARYSEIFKLIEGGQ